MSILITTKKHNKIVAGLQNTIEELKKQNDLKSILDKLTDKTNAILGSNLIGINDFVGISFPDNIAQYVDDLFGGTVIKQEAVKAIKIQKNGEIETGYTKQKPDKGYSYKLIRE